MNEPLFHALLELGDDNLILGQRLCEWCGQAPSLEIDISLSNLALDLIGQATLLLNYAGEVEGKGRDGDQLAFHRNATAFRNSLLVEQPNGDFARTIARHFLFSTYNLALFEKLEVSTDERIAEIAAKAVKELQYHAEFSANWVIRLGGGTAESHQRMVDGFDWFWRFMDDLLAVAESQGALADEGIIADRSGLRAGIDTRIDQILGEATLPTRPEVWQTTGGRQGVHTEHLGRMLTVMQVLPRSYPEAAW